MASTLRQIGSTWANFCQIRGNLGQLGPTCGQFWTNLCDIGPNLGTANLKNHCSHLGFSMFLICRPSCNLGANFVTYESSFGGILTLLWAVFAPTSPVLGPTWAHMEPSWRVLGLSWADLGANLGHPGAILEPTFGIFEPSWAPSGRLRANNGPTSS